MFAARLVQEETGFSHGSVCEQEVFASKKSCDTPFPFGGKRHQNNQSQSYMANHMIWLLRKRGKLWEGWQRKSESKTVISTAIGISNFES